MDESSHSLSEALSVVKVQGVQLKRFLDTDRVMDALKCASTMLGELRSSTLSPRHYYELYMAVFDALRHMSVYLYEAHTSGKHHLADLYELVQYCTTIVPRLYLMVTVGSVYMSVPDAPVNEIMTDVTEMCRGVQHPTRGLFLRHYLSGATRDALPLGTEPGPRGTLTDSIQFVLTNFIEMNKLWVRQQHLGHSREREKRETERRELRILVGTNLVRVSQLDGLTLALYQERVLPVVLEQVVQCKDLIAQEYLMEVIIQVFPDDFHLHTLPALLSACARLHPKVNVKQIVIVLLTRLATYAAREAENESPAETARLDKEVRAKLDAAMKAARTTPPLDPHAIWGVITDEQRHLRGTWSLFAEELGQVVPDEDADDPIWHDVPRRGILDPSVGEAREAEAHAPGPVDGGTKPGGTDQKDDTKPGGTDQKDDTKRRGADQKDDTEPDAPDQADHDTELDAPDQVDHDTEPDAPDQVDHDTATPDAPDRADHSPATFRGIPENVPLFAIFWEQIHLLLEARTELSAKDTVTLLLALLQLCLSCYPERLEYVDQILAFAYRTLTDGTSEGGDAANQPLLHALLLAPVQSYSSALTLLALPHFHRLWAHQPPLAQRAIAQAIARSMLQKNTLVTTPEEADVIFTLCASLIEDPVEQGVLNTPALTHAQQVFLDEVAEKQTMLAQLVHLLRANDPETQLTLLHLARQHLSRGGACIRYTFPALIAEVVKLTRQYQLWKGQEEWAAHLTTLFYFVHQLTMSLYQQGESAGLSVRLFLLAAEVADEAEMEELAYEFYVQAFTIYDESIPDSRAQFGTMEQIISTLHKARVFGPERYETLITKAAVYSAKLLKRPQQAAAVLMASHLWWQTEAAAPTQRPPVRDARRVLECLQKSLRIAHACPDAYVALDIFCHALSKYVYYFEEGVETIVPKHINALADLIAKRLADLPSGPTNQWDQVPSRAPALEATRSHFANQLHSLQRKREAALRALRDDVPASAGPDWGSIQVHAAFAAVST